MQTYKETEKLFDSSHKLYKLSHGFVNQKL